MTARQGFGRFVLAGLLACLAPPAAVARDVYVASQGAGTLVALTPGAKVGAPLAVARGPAQVAAGPDGRLYLTHPDTRQVSVVEDGAVLRILSVPGQPFGLAVSADAAHLYVGDWAGNRVLRLSAETGAVEGAVAVGREPAALLLDRRGRLYVADRESRQVSVIDTAGLTRIATIPVGEAPFAMALNPAEDRLYVANVRSGTLSVVDTEALKSVATFTTGGMPYGVAVSADGARILVTNQQAGALVVLDAADGAIRATVPVGRYPEGVAIAGPEAYVANWFSDSISVIDLASLRETARIAVPEGPRSLAIPVRGRR
ncbi:YncE family protein [Methylobacterium goesingense]|uniref:YVTN family beta-propeller protein n=1 Tax=Methylobacterium goesingense TaxID=243690 RepID=A0ABV2LAN3_9HYPH|nr:YncE family protein [Methylobacterium goesingense]GJD75758.1 Virginiamycin B lyase [Methylobacterium goesingense]